MMPKKRKYRTYYQQVAAAVSFESKLNAKLIAVTREHGKANFTYKHNRTGDVWRTTLTKLEKYDHNKYKGRAKKASKNCYSYSAWNQAGKVSNNFVAYQCYIIECKSKITKEKFYKIGKTFLNVNSRCRTLPYTYKILKVFKGDAFYISKLEHKLHKLNKKYKYTPSIRFNGQTECFSKLKKETYE